MIPSKYHNTLIGSGGKIVQSISEDCGGVQINFPDAKTKSDRVTLVGPREDVEKAKATLLGNLIFSLESVPNSQSLNNLFSFSVEMSREREQNSFTETLEANAQQHKFLIGKNYSNIRRVSSDYYLFILHPCFNRYYYSIFFAKSFRSVMQQVLVFYFLMKGMQILTSLPSLGKRRA